MVELSLHIEYLLLRHDCVIVPGFGAFIAGRRGARIDHQEKKILPPCREIGFNREVQTDDGLLAHSISRRSAISFEEARQQMQGTIHEIKETLLKEGEVTLGHVGTLLLGEEGKIVFHPIRRGEALSDAMGQYATRLSAESITPATEAAALDSSERLANNSSAEESSESPATYSEDNTENKRSPYYVIRIRKTYAHVAASLLLCIVLAVSLLLPGSSRREEDKAYASVIPIHTSIGKKSEREKKKHPAPAKQTVQNTTSGNKEENEQTTSVAGHGTDSYYLIVATFRTQKEADAYISAADKESSGLFRVDGKKLHRVAAEKSESKELLRARLNTPEVKNKYPGAWIWKSEEKR